MRTIHLAATFSFVALAALPAQVLTFAEGAPGALQIVSVAESAPNGGDTVVLVDVELLPIEIAGRTLAMETETARSRRVDRDGLERVELPQGGRLFRYRRQAGAFWGFLCVLPDGSAQVVLERAGTGATFADPFADRIGVAADGQHAVVPRLSGGAYVVRLDGGTFASTGLASRLAIDGSIEVDARSVMVGPQVVFCVAKNANDDDVLLRCGLDDLDQPVDISPPALPGGEFKPQLALSGDGARAAFLYGVGQSLRIHLVGVTGAATVLTPVASHYEEPGYLPEGPGEPAMLLDETGDRLFYVDADVRDELYLGDTSGVLPTLQITENAWFQPYIGLHILPRHRGGRLIVAIGDLAAMDVFAAELDPAGGSVQNLTNTGAAVPPFVSGALDPTHAMMVGNDLLLTDLAPTGASLRRIDAVSGGLVTVATDVVGVPGLGGALPGVAGDALVTTLGGARLFAGATGALLAELPPGIDLTPPVHGPLYAATWVQLAGGIGAIFVYGSFGIASGQLEVGVEQLAVTPLGGLVVVGAPLRYLAPGTYAVLNRPAATIRRCLSGA